MPGVSISGPGTGFAAGNAIIDLAWEFQGILSGTSEANLTIPVGSSGRNSLLAAMQGALPFTILTGGVATLTKDVGSGVRALQITSGAGSRTTRLMGSPFGVPVGAAAGQGAVIPAWRPNRRYTVGAVLRWPVRGATVIEVGCVNSNGFLTFLGTTPGFVLSSDPGVNGGLWTPRVRLVDAGAITTFASTGLAVPTATAQKIELRYTEGGVPLLEMLINGVTVASAAGMASLPTALVGASSFAFGVGCSAAAGTTVEYAAWTYKVEEI